MSRFQTIALIGRYQTQGVGDTLSKISRFLIEAGRSLLIEADTAQATGLATGSNTTIASLAEIGSRADLAIVLGGDGTMLGVARELAPFNMPLVGINHGRLGFITDIALDRWPQALSAVLAGNYDIEYRQLLRTNVLRNKDADPKKSINPQRAPVPESVFSALALNDVVIGRSSGSRMVELDVTVNDLFMYTQRADGLIVSTPTGSTAYSLSANGPILHPQLEGMVLVPVAPQALGSRPIVIPANSRILIQMRDASEARVHCDMQTFADLQDLDQIVVEKAEFTSHFVHPHGYSYFDTLRSKLNWQALPTHY